VAGGALQGLEVTYLARKAGYETLLLDRRNAPPAAGLCHSFVRLDLEDRGSLARALKSVDVVIPAVENTRALRSLAGWCEKAGVPLAFDHEAYAISASKTASNALFERLNIPAPASWPDCAFPIVAKPDGGSGSKRIEVLADGGSLEARFGAAPPVGWVLQEYLAGPSFSIEVVGRPGAYTPLQITDLEMDGVHDCKRVLAPASLPSRLAGTFREIAVTLAGSLSLSGIMDVEAILHHGVLRVLEIDARFPSQTPAAVYHASGVNMVESLTGIFCENPDHEPLSAPRLRKGASILEHIRVRPGHLSVSGESAIGRAGPLHLEKDFFGAYEALTDYTPGSMSWVATLMIRGSDRKDAWACREQIIGEIRTRCGLAGYDDQYPPGEEPAE
jgi:pyrrolysine biosynthesis protein PylC